jgi:Flp pilus assembly protein TadG
MRRITQRGASLVEMTLVGIPVLFTLILTFEMSRGMWIYSTLAYAAREATRYVVTHGQNCLVVPGSSTACPITAQDLGNVISQAATGLIPKDLTVTFTSEADSFTCTDDDLINNNTGNCTGTVNNPIPFTGGNVVGHPISVSLLYPFYTAFFGSNLKLPAYSRDLIRF